MRNYAVLGVSLVALTFMGCAEDSTELTAPEKVLSTTASTPTPTPTPTPTRALIVDTSSLDEAAVACGITVAHTEGHGYWSSVFKPEGKPVATASLMYSGTMKENIDGILTEESVDCFLGKFTPDVTVQTLTTGTAEAPVTKMWFPDDESMWTLSGSGFDLMGQVRIGWLYI
jgi:hypothetical protein